MLCEGRAKETVVNRVNSSQKKEQPTMKSVIICLCVLTFSLASSKAGSVSGAVDYPGSKSGPIRVTGWKSTTLNQVLSLDGDSDFARVDGITDLSGSELSVQYWFKGNSFQSAVRQQSGAGWIVAGWNKLHIMSIEDGVNGLSAGPGVDDGNWHHLVLSWKQNTENGFATYLDGKPVAQRNSVDTPIPNLESPLFFGAFNGAGEWSNGMLDEIGVWNRALTAEEIAQNWFKQLSGDEEGLIGYWSFDDGDVLDLSPNAFHGVLEGDAQIVTADVAGLGKGLFTATLDAPGSYTLSDAPAGDGFNVTAFMDVNGNGAQEPDEPEGTFIGNPFSVSGDIASVDILLTEPPFIITQAESLETDLQSEVVFEIEAGGSEPLSFQWFRDDGPISDGGNISGANTSRLVISSFEKADEGFYNASVTNEKGIVLSRAASLMEFIPRFTLSGEVSYEGARGIPGNRALNLDGVDDYVETSLMDLSGETLTIQYWFKGESIQSAVRQQGAGFIVAGWNGLHILSFDGGVGGLSAGEGVTDGNWHHVAMTWQINSTGGFRTYLDGSLVESRDSGQDPIPAMDVPVTIGSFNGLGEYSKGMIDEVSVWKRVLSQSEIRNGMRSSLEGDEEGLLGYWNFDDGTAGDSSVNGYDGTFIGGAETIESEDRGGAGNIVVSVSQPKLGNRTLLLDGTDDFVKISDPNPDLSGSELSIQFWFRGEQFQSSVRQQGGGQWIVAGWSANGLHLLSNDGGVSGISAGGFDNVTDGNWHHLVMTWKQNTPGGFSSYFDGVLVDRRNSSDTPISQIPSGLFFGTLIEVAEFAKGNLDEIAIFNRALTETDVARTWNKTLTGAEPGLIGFWNFDDDTANDLGPLGHHGEFINGAFTEEAIIPPLGGQPAIAVLTDIGAFEIPEVRPGENYVLSGFIDNNGDGVQEPDEPVGFYSGNPFNMGFEDQGGFAVNFLDPVVLRSQPDGGSVTLGSDLTLSVEFTGSEPFEIQWFRDGEGLSDGGRINGSNTASLSISGITRSEIGAYRVEVSNSFSSVTSGVAVVSIPAANIREGLVGHWKFDETSGVTATDSSVNNNVGELVEFLEGDPEWWVDGNIGGSIQFRSEFNQFVLVPDYPKGKSMISASVWAYADSAETWGSMIKNWGDSVEGQMHLGLHSADGDVSIFAGTESGTSAFARSGQPFLLNSWHHVAFSADGSTIRIYVDGELAGEGSYTPPLIESQIGGLGIGAKLTDEGDFSALGAPGFWNGRLDDVGVWDRALTGDELRGIYQAGLEGKDLSQAVSIAPPVEEVTLSISQSAGQIEISWPSVATGVQLESTQNPGSGNWSPANGTPTDSDGTTRIVIEIDLVDIVQVFRLIQP